MKFVKSKEEADIEISNKLTQTEAIYVAFFESFEGKAKVYIGEEEMSIQRFEKMIQKLVDHEKQKLCIEIFKGATMVSEQERKLTTIKPIKEWKNLSSEKQKIAQKKFEGEVEEYKKYISALMKMI